MKILLIQAYLGRKGKEALSFPLGLAYLYDALEDHEVTVFDPNIVERPFEEMKKVVEKTDPDIFGLSLRNIDTAQSYDVFSYLQSFVSTLELVKQMKPDAKIVVGGTGFSMFAREIMAKFPEIDYGVFVEAEYAFPQLLERMDHPERVRGIYFRNSGKVFFTGRSESIDFNQLPVPTREFPDVDIRKYAKTPFSIGVQTKRGCAFRCAYCIYPFLQGRHLRLRSPEKVVDEIENLTNFYGIEELFFADTVFNFPLNHAREICRELMKRKLHIEWRAWFREDCINKRFIIQVRNAGCDVLEFSPDGGSQRALDVLQKDLRVQDIVKTYELAREAEGIRIVSNFMCNVPGEDSRTVADFYKFLFKIAGKYSTVLEYMGLTNIRIYPNTKIYQIALKEGLISRETDLLTPTFYDPPPLNIAYLPAKWTRGQLPILPVLRKISHTFHSIRSRSRGRS